MKFAKFVRWWFGSLSQQSRTLIVSASIGSLLGYSLFVYGKFGLLAWLMAGAAYIVFCLCRYVVREWEKYNCHLAAEAQEIVDKLKDSNPQTRRWRKK